MKTISPVRPLAGILFQLTRFLSVFYWLIAAYAFIITALALNGVSGLPVSGEGSGVLTIFYPFTEKPFLLIDTDRSFLITSSLVVIFYGIFLVLLTRVFDAFRQERLFTPKGVRSLTSFYAANFLLPIAAIVVLLATGEPIGDLIIITVLHFILGIFIYFMTAIFKQGLELQNEQDLTF